MEERIWLTWETQRRNRSLSAALGARLFELDLRAPRWVRYPWLVVQTLWILATTRPRIILAQNPSLILAGLVTSCGKLFSLPVIIDAHNAGLFPLEGNSRMLNRIARTFNGMSTAVIVSNPELKELVEAQGIRSVAIPDPVPEINSHSGFVMPDDKQNVVYVCSWSSDEPYMEVLKAAAEVADSTRIYITGNSKGKERKLNDGVPENVVLTGFIPGETYEDLLLACDVVMVLTSRENCLVCGAYEGIAAEKPLILSNTRALMEFFNKGCIYTENTQQGIADALRRSTEYTDLSVQEIRELKDEKQLQLGTAIEKFDRYLNSLVSY
jgi:glycosyltransferase involved in cell wall biosynthesis